MEKARRVPPAVYLPPKKTRAHLAVFRQRKNERSRSYDEFLVELKREGRI